MRPRRIYLVDDNAEFRRSASWWLSGAGYQVIDFADAPAALAALQKIAEQEPAALRDACLLVDVRMPGMSGLDLHDRLCDCGVTGPCSGAHATLPVVYMSGHGDVPLAVRAMQKGAVTFLEKPFADDALESALARAFGQVAANEPLHPAPPATPADDAPDDPPRREYLRRLASLSPRQREVFDGVVAGKLSKVIAYESGLSPKTVEFHRKHMMLKFQARSALELMRMAVAQRVEPGASSAA
jgi:two-component system response regulator FixJ